MLNRSFYFLSLLLVIFSCSKTVDSQIQGVWNISKIEFESDSSNLSFENLLVNSIVPKAMKPQHIEISGDALELKTLSGESSSLGYQITEKSNKRVILKTEKGEASFAFLNSDNAEFTIAGAKYYLIKE